MNSTVAGSEAQDHSGKAGPLQPGVQAQRGLCGLKRDAAGWPGSLGSGRGTRHTACALPELVTREFNHAAQPFN